MLYMFLADGFEEIEALATLDIIRRANIEIATVGVTGENVTGAHNISVKADVNIDDINFDDLTGVILPGGLPGTTHLDNSSKVCELTVNANDRGLLVSAICAAPSVLGRLGLLKGKKATCYPGFEDKLSGAECTDEYVVRDGNIITGRGAGAAIEFGLKIVEYFKGDQISNELRKTMQCAH